MRAVFGALLASTVVVAAAAQEPPASPFVGRTVAGIVVSLEGTNTSDPSLSEAIQTAAGKPLAMADVRDTITHLYGLGRFEDVSVEAQAAPDGGVIVRYNVVPVHIVTSVQFRGVLGLTEKALRDRIAEKFGSTPPLSRASDVAGALESFYHEQGYLKAAVTPGPPILEHTQHSATLVLDVAAGPRTTIAKSTVTGHPLESVQAVQRRLRIAPGDLYKVGELSARLSEYTAWMRHQGHYEAITHEERPAFSSDAATVDVTVNVEPGPLVRVRYEGDPLPKAKIDDLVPIEREGSVDPDLLEDSARRIKDALNQEGYWKADVPPPERREENAELVLVFHITRGAQYRVAPGGVEVTGNLSVPLEQLRSVDKSGRPSTDLITDTLPAGALFLESRLAAVASAIKQVYLTKGFAQVEVNAQTNEAGPGLAKPVVSVKEGPRFTVGDVSIAGNKALPVDRLMRKVTIKKGDVYYGANVIQSRDAIEGEYLDAGYASAHVTVPPPKTTVTTPKAGTADVRFEVEEGPQTIVEHVFVTGNFRTRREVITRELRFSEGQPLGLEQLTETRRRLASLGLFRRISIVPISHGDPSRSDVVITVEEAPRNTVGYGGGVEVDRIRRSDENGVASDQYEFAPRGFFEVGRRNLGGSNRSVDLYTRLSLRPSNDPNDSNPFGFPEYRVVATYREPRALKDYGDLTATGAIEQAVRTGFNFARKGINAELTHQFTPTLRGSARYSLSTTRVFDLQPSLLDVDPTIIDRAFPQLRLSAFSLAVSRDTRDDPADAHRGSLVSADGSVAARIVGSEVGYIKTFFQGFGYRRLGTSNVVFAGAARLGLARGFPRPVDVTNPDTGVVQTVIVRNLPASERFFAGGGTTVRGYAADTVGVPETITPTGFPIGGDATVIFNGELRFPVKSAVGGVLFADAGNVFVRADDVELTNLIGSVGTGIRVKTPFGSMRLDVGFPLERRFVGPKRERGFAFHFSIGQAF